MIDLNDPGCWFNQQQCDLVYDKLVEKTRNLNLARETGQFISVDKGMGAIRQYVLGMISPRKIYLSMDKLYRTVSKAADVRVRDLSPDRIEITTAPKPGVQEKSYQCEYRLGSFESIMRPFVGKLAEVEHPECYHRGAQECKYIIKMEITRSDRWKRIRNVCAGACLLLIAGSFFFLPTPAMVLLLLSCLAGIGVLSTIGDHIFETELKSLIENQAQTAKELIDETNNRYTYSLVMQHVGQATLSLFNEREICEKVLDILSEYLSYTRGYILSVNGSETPFMQVSHGYDEEDGADPARTLQRILKKSATGLDELLKKNKPVVIETCRNGAADGRKKEEVFHVLLPMEYENQNLGILGLEMVMDGKRIRKSDLNLLMGVASQISLSIMNARSYEKLKENEKRLQHAIKMESLGTMASGISHEFNNILASIILNAEFALEGITNRQITEYSLGQILKAGNYAKKLILQILTYSRKSEHEKEILNICEVVNETIEMLNSMLPSTILIRRSLPDRDLYIPANRVQIQQILLNLGHNAADAMNRSGTLEIKLDFYEDPNFVGDTPLVSGRFVRMTFQDSGVGIPSENLDRIFDPFYTTKEKDAGTGLGLSVVYGIVKSHGGRIEVESEVEKGTLFRIYFPLSRGIAQDRKKKVSATIEGGSESILLVDDEELVVDIIQRYLENLGYQITTAPNGVEGLAIFQANPERFDLIITDMNMAHIDGFTLYQRAKEIRKDIPVILCSGHAELHEVKTLKTDISDFLFKPVSMKELSSSIRKVLS